MLIKSPYFPLRMTSAALKLMRPFMKSRLAGKIRTFRNVQDLSRAIDLKDIPASLGGDLTYDHAEWTTQHIVGVDLCILRCHIRAQCTPGSCFLSAFQQPRPAP